MPMPRDEVDDDDVLGHERAHMAGIACERCVCVNGCPAPQCVFVSRCAPEVDMPITPVAKREIWLRLGFMRVTFGAGHTTHGAPNPDFCIRFIYFSVR